MASAGPLRNVAEYTNEVRVDQVKRREPLRTIENKIIKSIFLYLIEIKRLKFEF